MLRTNFFKTALASMLVMCVVGLYSCGGGKKTGEITKEVDEYGQTKMTRTINVDNVTINEEGSTLTKWFEILSGSGVVIYQDYGADEDEAATTFDFRLRKLKDYSNYNQGDIYLYLLDKDGKYIVDEDDDPIKFIGESTNIWQINNLAVNDKLTVKFFYSTSDGMALSKKAAKSIFDKANRIEIYSTADKIELGTSETWDSVLDEFEKAINSLYKDVSNMSNLNTVENLQSKLENNKDELTETQKARLNRLIKRID